jgi:hypothetical protein
MSPSAGYGPGWQQSGPPGWGNSGGMPQGQQYGNSYGAAPGYQQQAGNSYGGPSNNVNINNNYYAAPSYDRQANNGPTNNVTVNNNYFTGAADQGNFQNGMPQQQNGYAQQANLADTSSKLLQCMLTIVNTMMQFMMTMMAQMQAKNAAASGQPPAGSINFNDNNAVQQKMQELAGKDPKVTALVDKYLKASPESKDAAKLQAELSAAMKKAKVPDNSIKQFFLLASIRQLNATCGQLPQVASNLDPNSPQAQQIQQRMTAINQQKATLIQQYQQAGGTQTTALAA